MVEKQRVLITGASAGLGEGFARAYAARGADVVLVARDMARLKALAGELEASHGICAHAMSVDLLEAGAVERLVLNLEEAGLEITRLVNNAGFGLNGAFLELDGSGQARMIDLNCRVPMELAHALAPAMVARGEGGILNVSSIAAFQPGPWMAVYYASKAFLLSFSEALHHELLGSGVRVSALCPGPTRTEFFARAHMEEGFLFRHLAGDRDSVVADGIAALEANRAVKVSGALNAVMASSMRITPRPLARRLAAALQQPAARKNEATKKLPAE